MKIITISREFGSGGRELGKRLAEELGISPLEVTKFGGKSVLLKEHLFGEGK